MKTESKKLGAIFLPWTVIRYRGNLAERDPRASSRFKSCQCNQEILAKDLRTVQGNFFSELTNREHQQLVAEAHEPLAVFHETREEARTKQTAQFVVRQANE